MELVGGLRNYEEQLEQHGIGGTIRMIEEAARDCSPPLEPHFRHGIVLYSVFLQATVDQRLLAYDLGLVQFALDDLHTCIHWRKSVPVELPLQSEYECAIVAAIYNTYGQSLAPASPLLRPKPSDHQCSGGPHAAPRHALEPVRARAT